MLLLVPDLYRKKSLRSATSTRHLNRHDFGIESHVFISQHVFFFPFSFVSLFTFIKWQMTSPVNWQIWRHNSISFVAVWASRLCQIGSPYTISDQYHNHIFSHLQSVGLWIFHWTCYSFMGPHTCLCLCLSVCLSLSLRPLSLSAT